MLSRLSRTMPPIDAPTSQLSGGQRQAIAIARAAAWGSKVIIMDEPTAALGPAETRAVEEVIAGLRDRGFAVLIISHNLEQVFRLVDRVWVLRRGRMIGNRWLEGPRPMRWWHDHRRNRGRAGQGGSAEPTAAIARFRRGSRRSTMSAATASSSSSWRFGDPDGDVAAVPHRGESAQRAAAELGHRHHRLRHDLRHHLRWVRSVGRSGRGAGQCGRGQADDRGGDPPWHRSARCSRGWRWACSMVS